MHKTGRIALLLLLLAVSLPSMPVFALTRIMNVRHWTAPDHTRVVIDTNDEARYRVEKNDKIVSIGFAEAFVDEKVASQVAINKAGISSVTIQSLPDNAARVELLLSDGAETKVFSLKKIQDKPDRLVIDIWLPDVQKKESEEREQVKIQRKERIVVIDPGHGGEDTGAIGKDGTREKDVVLSLSRKLRDTLNKKDGYRAFLTREGDYYVSFRKRLKVAREYGADLFISVHADAARNRTARGSSVYCLSLGGASSEAAKILARNENLADIIGGSENGNEKDESEPILLNMFQTNTINQSKAFGHCLLGNLQEVSRPKSRRVQEAPFRVLKLPEIPALLLETAYISNPREEKLLRSAPFQTRVARALADSITEFLPLAPPPSPAADAAQPAAQPAIEQKTKTKPAMAVKEQEAPASRPAVYQVRKGDTLGKIAARHNTTLGALLKLNRMKLGAPLYVGRKIKLEEVQKVAAGKKGKQAGGAGKGGPRTTVVKAPPAASAASFYRVRKGDTLAKVASKHKTTISVLLKLNHIRMKDPLYVNQKLILPHDASL
ncbi:MAG: N-acetylmuramoyl-L-alanine amidase [Deltaproteobacteria bacterium]|nr:N-acetylmuramoyl-L-alanine amidase [Deltaproteobacteria bacterium]